MVAWHVHFISSSQSLKVKVHLRTKFRTLRVSPKAT